MTFSRDRGVNGRREPPVFPNSARAEHRVILTVFLCRIVRFRIERIAHRYTAQRVLLDTVVYLWHLQSGNLQNRWNDIHGMVVLIPDLAARLNPFGPRNHERVGSATRVL